MLNLIWPIRCLGCDTTGRGRLCARCSRVTSTLVLPKPEGVCSAVAVAPYDSPLATVLRYAKYTPDRSAAVLLAKVFANTLTCAIRELAPAGLVPVPTPAWRSVRRGFGVTALFARHLHRATHIPITPVLQIRGGPRQASLDASARRMNLRGRVRCPHELSGHFALIDDVMTTGTTLASCARELLGSGADAVHVFTLCHATTSRSTSD